VYADMQNAVASSERVFSLIDTQPGIRDLEQTLPFTPLSGDIEFDNVSFHYKEDEPVIKHLSFT